MIKYIYPHNTINYCMSVLTISLHVCRSCVMLISVCNVSWGCLMLIAKSLSFKSLTTVFSQVIFGLPLFPSVGLSASFRAIRNGVLSSLLMTWPRKFRLSQFSCIVRDSWSSSVILHFNCITQHPSVKTIYLLAYVHLERFDLPFVPDVFRFENMVMCFEAVHC